MSPTTPRGAAPSFRPWYGLLLVALVAVLLGVGLTLYSRAAGAGSQGAAAAPEAGSAEDTPFLLGHADVTGGVVPLYPLQPNRVVKVLAREYEHVDADAVLLQMDEKLARDTLREAEAALKAAEAQQKLAELLPGQHAAQIEGQKAAVQEKQAAVEAATSMLERGKERLKNGTIKKDEYDALVKQKESAEAGRRAEQVKLDALKLLKPQWTVERAKQDVASKTAQRDKALQGVEECKVKAPAAGLVIRVLVAEGETLGPNPRQPAIYFVPDDKPLIVRAEVEQEWADLVHAGMVVDIYDDTRAEGARWSGKVETVSNWYTHRRSIMLEPLQYNDVRTLECIIHLDPPKKDGKPLRIGQKVRVKPRKDTGS
jgi:multidrug resistance efflux pump